MGAAYQAKTAIFAFVTVPWASVWLLVSSKQDIPTRGMVLTGQAAANKRLAGIRWQAVECAQVQWLMAVFARWFAHRQTVLVRGDDEPQYYAKTAELPAQIVFAHGFFASCLHEISHWCIAGQRRRGLDDFGYWYAPDGRDAAQQREFEQVEIAPQALECLFTLALGKRFRVSTDNLNAIRHGERDTQFDHNVYRQALVFLAQWQTPNPDTAPSPTGKRLSTDARLLLNHLCALRPYPLMAFDVAQNFAYLRLNAY